MISVMFSFGAGHTVSDSVGRVHEGDGVAVVMLALLLS